MKKTLSWITLSLSFLMILTGLVGMALSADEPKGKTKKEKTPAEKAEQPPKRVVYTIQIDAPITPVVTEYIIKSIDKATKAEAEALIIELDTPGGLVESTREIVKKMIVSDVPIVVYVSPSGSRAASAGVFITIAANIAAMAPSTRIGAASPVQMQGKMDETMAKKVTNDLAAMARGLAERRGKNPKWAEDAVRKAVSITEKEALKKNVIDLIAPDMETLIKKINGRTVETGLGKKTIRTRTAEVKEITMGFRYKLLEVISNPNIAYILMILGFYGLYFELANPGVILPGVAGAICLILAFYALQTLPINYAGLMLIILGIGLFIAEAFITSGGVLGVGGVVAMLFGSVMLIDSPSPFMKLSWAVIIPVVAVSAALFIISLTVAIKVHKEKPDTGKEGLLGLEGEARTDVHAAGQIFIHGELWSAHSDEPVQKGDRVVVEVVEGFKLKVKKI